MISDDEIQLAQLQKSYSEDLFTSQETDMKLTASIQTPFQTKSTNEDNIGPSVLAPDSDDISKEVNNGTHGGNVAVICETQPFDDVTVFSVFTDHYLLINRKQFHKNMLL